MFRTLVLGLSLALPAINGLAYAQDGVAGFYKGKTIHLIVGGSVGVSYDIMGRLLASHITRHIPGQPNIVVENMPGASSVIMTNHLFNRAARDGTVIGAPLNNILLEPKLNLMSGQGTAVQFDLSKMNWIGSPLQEPQVLVVWGNTGVKTLQDMRGKKLIMGGTAVGADNHTLPSLVNNAFGLDMQIILGYKGPGDVFVAMERGEVHGLSTAHSTLMVTRSDWVADGRVRPVLQFGGARVHDLAETPTAIEIAPDAESKQVFEFIASKFILSRPYVLPPGVPPERVAALRRAFDATMEDPAFLAQAKKLNLLVGPVSGAEMEKIIERINATPDAIIDRVRAIFKK